MSKAIELLKKHWGFNSFREPQEAIIKELLDKKDAFVLLPTGAGKSLCYQLPALLSDGVCLVISPLIALMEDQVKSLEAKGIKALMLSSKLNRHDTIVAFDNLQFGNYKFLYLSPEKLQSEFIQEKISQLHVNLIAIDEAHCISQWGHDFRPAYLKIPVLNEMHPHTPRIALTATATSLVKSDIIENLNLIHAKVFSGSYYRKNLQINIEKTADIRGRILKLVQSVDEPIIIYVSTRKSTLEYRQLLNAKQINATAYHGGLTYKQKTSALDEWSNENSKVMVATNAFGMGIDKSNVRMIIHAHLPNSIENFMQEIGRAGRDGKDAKTYLLYNENTIWESKNMIQKSTVSPEFCKMVYAKLNDYYQIANGEIQENLFSFDLQEFAVRYQFNLSEVYHALNHLHHEDIIFYDQNPNKSSRIKIVENASKLYEIQSAQNHQGRVLQLLLRTYGGIHEQFTPINEGLLAVKSGLDKKYIIKALHTLEKDKAIIYDKSSSVFTLRFLVPREDNFIFNTIKKNIQQRNQIKIEKLKAIQQMVSNDFICRQIQLLRYFGEKLDQPCGACDVCLRKNSNQTVDHKELADKVLRLLDLSKALDINEISTALSIDKRMIIKTLELLVEKRSIDLNLQNKFYIIS